MRSEYNGTVDCGAAALAAAEATGNSTLVAAALAEAAARPLRTCYVNQCLCDVDRTRDPTRVTLLPETDANWYDAFAPDLWVPGAWTANYPLAQQYGMAVFWAVSATTSVGMNIVPRSETEQVFSVLMIFFGIMIVSGTAGAARAGGRGAARRGASRTPRPNPLLHSFFRVRARARSTR